MKLSKKLCAALLIVVMLFATAVTSGLAASKITFTDVSDTSPYKEAIDSLVSLGLLLGYTDGTFKPEATISRAEFAAVMTRAIGMSEVASSASSKGIFSDLVQPDGTDHWASGYVKVAYDSKIIAGYGDGLFGPDDPVTYEQAVKMIVCAVGFEQQALELGGWPVGYLQAAQERGITKNGAIMSPSSAPAPRGMVAKLVYNALEVYMMEVTTTGDYTQTKKTLLTDKLKVMKLTNAMVTDVDGVSSLNPGTSTLKAGEMMLEVTNNSGKYQYDSVLTSTEARALLGQYVNCYYKYDANLDIRTIISISATAKSNTISVLADDVRDYNGSTRTLQYWTDRENDKRGKDLKISPTAKLVLNGVAYDYLSDVNPADKQNLSYWLSPTKGTFLNGEVTLIDSGSDGDVNVIFMYNYQTFVLSKTVTTNDPVYANNYVIYDYYVPGKGIQIDPEDRDITVTIQNAKDKSAMNIEYIQPMNIISIAESPDSKLFTCYVSTATTTGTITEVSSDGKYYTIGTKRYALTPEFKAALTNGKEVMDLDTNGTFYLDMYNRIAAVKVSAQKAGNYAYITKINKGNNVGDPLQIRLFTPSSNSASIITCADRVRVNGTSYNSAEEIELALSQAANLLTSNKGNAIAAAHTQLVKYTTNSSGKIDSILTAATSGGMLQIGASTNTSILQLGAQKHSVVYTRENNFSDEFYIDASTTVIIAVPDNRNDVDGYSKKTASSFFKVGNSYDVEIFDVNNKLAKAVVVYGNNATVAIDEDTPVSIIKNIVQTTSKLQPGTGTVLEIEVYQSGQSATIKYETESTGAPFSGLGIGDVVRLGLNNYGQVNQIKSVQTASSLSAGKQQEVPYEGTGFEFKTISGTTYLKTGTRIQVAPAFVDGSGNLDITDTEGWDITSSTKVYTVTTQGAGLQVNPGTDSSISEYGEGKNINATKVVLYIYKNELKTIVIYSI